jgi:hypothetical protein
MKVLGWQFLDGISEELSLIVGCICLEISNEVLMLIKLFRRC